MAARKKKGKPAAFNRKAPGPRLTERQRRFVEHYLQDPNATAAARAAGWSHPEQSGYRALRNAQVSRAIEAVTGEATRAAIADREERLEILTTIARGELKGAKPKDIIAAANVMSRMNGEQLIRAEVKVNAELEGKPLEELIGMLGKALE